MGGVRCRVRRMEGSSMGRLLEGWHMVPPDNAKDV
jgi:hypothetical protein